MSSHRVEFIATNKSFDDSGVVIKEEELPFEPPKINTSKSKCGEIFSLHGGNFILICEFCNGQFENMPLFGAHIRDKHQDGFSHDTRPECPKTSTPNSPVIEPESVKMESHDCMSQRSESPACSDSFNMGFNSSEESSEKSDHEKTPNHTGNEITCDSSNRKCRNKRTLNRRQRISGCKQNQPEAAALFCVPCSRQLKTMRNFQRHVRMHEQTAQEQDAANDSTDATRMEKITVEIPEDPALFCEFCNRYFKSKNTLRNHSNKNHDQVPLALQQDDEFLKCRFCMVALSDIRTLKEHESTHNGPRPYQCPHCEKCFDTNYKRRNHLRVHTGERPYLCTQCPNSYMYKTELSRHIKRHLNQREFPCEICGKRFYRHSERSIHMRSHTGERPYVCEDCGNSFVVLGQLREHQKRHTKTKNFKCEVCGRFFYSKSILKDHQAAHSDEKPFSCEVCGRRFPRVKALKKHMKLHSDVKEYVCNICGKEYAQNSGLYAHKKTHGGG